MPDGSKLETLSPEDLLTPDELAARLKVKKSWVLDQTRNRAKVRGNVLPHIHLGKYLRFSWPDVAAWLEKQKE